MSSNFTFYPKNGHVFPDYKISALKLSMSLVTEAILRVFLRAIYSAIVSWKPLVLL